MNTSATYLPNTTTKADSVLVAPFAALYAQRSKMRVWAFSAAVRLSDQDKPIALKLLVELAIVVRTLAVLAKNSRCAHAKTVVASRAVHAVARRTVRRIKPAKRSTAAVIRPAGVVAAQRKLPGKVMKTSRTGRHSPWIPETSGKVPQGRNLSAQVEKQEQIRPRYLS